MAKKEEIVSTGGNSEKLKALQAAMQKIEKDFGKGSIMKLGDDQVEEVEVIPSGSMALDAALGVGGYPKGRIIEIYGPESSGKTTLAIHAIAEAQKAGGIAAFIDAEHAFDRFYAEKLGVNIDELLISQPDNGEQALEIADQLIRSSAIDIIVVSLTKFFRLRIEKESVRSLAESIQSSMSSRSLLLKSSSIISYSSSMTSSSFSSSSSSSSGSASAASIAMDMTGMSKMGMVMVAKMPAMIAATAIRQTSTASFAWPLACRPASEARNSFLVILFIGRA